MYEDYFCVRKTPNILPMEMNFESRSFSPPIMPPQTPGPNYVNFTTTAGNVICQRCKVSFPQGVELHFLHDQTGEGPGKNVCAECCQYYITKTARAAQSTIGKFLIED